MKLPDFITQWLLRKASYIAIQRDPDFIIGTPNSPYVKRWWVIPRNAFFNIYLHQFLRSDDDRALHDHPWINCSILIAGEYTEHTIAAGGIHNKVIREAGQWHFRWPRSAHRIELHRASCWTIFITGPRIRMWGFHCPEAGWIPWDKFTAPDDPGAIGKGCDQ